MKTKHLLYILCNFIFSQVHCSDTQPKRPTHLNPDVLKLAINRQYRDDGILTMQIYQANHDLLLPIDPEYDKIPMLLSEPSKDSFFSRSLCKFQRKKKIHQKILKQSNN